jgi:hypothetical protein
MLMAESWEAMLAMESDEAMLNVERIDPKERKLTKESTDRMLSALKEVTREATLKLLRKENVLERRGTSHFTFLLRVLRVESLWTTDTTKGGAGGVAVGYVRRLLCPMNPRDDISIKMSRQFFLRSSGKK